MSTPVLVAAPKLKILIYCLLLVSISVHVHVACVCIAVYWASPLILIFQVMTDYDYPSNMDPYDYLGYGTDFEECADEFSD